MEKFASILQVNGRLLSLKLHYFFLMAAIACVFPFQSIIAKGLGLSASEVGVIFCAVPFFKLITNPIFGFLLDKFKKIRLTLSFSMLMLAIVYLSINLIPPKSVLSWNTEKNGFYTKVISSCQNETHPYVCDPKLLMYNEYIIMNTSKKNENSFDCEIQCSNRIEKSNAEIQLHPSPERRLEFNAHVVVSICDIDIRIYEDEMKILIGNVSQSVSVYERKSSSNCSEEIKTVLKETPRKASENKQINQDEKNASYVVSGKVEKGMKIYAHREFLINASNGGLINHILSSFEFDCRIKMRYSKSQYRIKAMGFQSLQFWSLLMLFAVTNATYNAIGFMTDTVCHEMLRDGDQFGKQRMFGTIGWGVGCFVAGYLNQIASTDSEDTDYRYSFYLLAFILLVDLIPVQQLQVNSLQYSPDILKDVCFLFTKFDIIYNLTAVYFIGILTGFIFNYEFWLMKEMGSSQMLLGLSQTFECLFELPCFMLSFWILKKIGHDHSNSVVFICFGLRYLCFFFMYNPWWSLAAALFHGPTFGLFIASMTTYAKNEAPPGTEATVQSLLQIFFEGLGTGTGSILGGIGLDKFGCRNCFLYAAKLSFAMLAINTLWTIYNSRRQKKKPKTLPNNMNAIVVKDDIEYSVIIPALSVLDADVI